MKKKINIFEIIGVVIVLVIIAGVGLGFYYKDEVTNFINKEVNIRLDNILSEMDLTGPAGTNGKNGTNGDKGKDGTNGINGLTPYIGENGNWFIGETDTGVVAEGKDGKNGEAAIVKKQCLFNITIMANGTVDTGKFDFVSFSVIFEIELNETLPTNYETFVTFLQSKIGTYETLFGGRWTYLKMPISGRALYGSTYVSLQSVTISSQGLLDFEFVNGTASVGSRSIQTNSSFTIATKIL